MTSSTKQLSFYNILVFTIVTGIFSLILVLLLLFDQFKGFFKFVVTVEIGLIIIIVWCIYTIMKSSKQTEMPNLVINYGDCPDYYIQNKDFSGNPYCENGYLYNDSKGNTYTMSIFNASNLNNPYNTFGSGSNDNTTGQPVGNKSAQTWFPYTDSSMMGTSGTIGCPNSVGPDLQAKCSILFSDPSTTSANSFMAGTNKIPWTYMQSRCEAYLPNGGNASTATSQHGSCT